MTDQAIPSQREERALARSMLATPDISPILASATASEGSQDLLIQSIKAVLNSVIPEQIALVMETLRREIQISGQLSMPARQTPSSGPSSPSASIGHSMDSMREPYSPKSMEERGISSPPYPSVHQRAYKVTSDEVVKTCRALKITSNSGDILRKIDAFHAALRITNLEKLLNGDRPLPVQTLDNPNGYTARKTAIMNDVNSMTEEDDFYFFNHDMKRLFHLVMCLFDDSLHYHCPEDIKLGNGISVYNKIIAKVNGQALRDVDIAQTNLDNFRFNPNKPIPSELYTLDEFFSSVEHAGRNIIPDVRKMNMLSKLILKDPRTLFHTVVAHTHDSYSALKISICSLYDNLPASHQTVKMAAMSADAPKQICFKHQRGKCIRGKSCPYSHDLVDKVPPAKGAPHKDREKKEHHKKEPHQHKPPFDFSNINLPDKIKKAVGPPAGKPAIYNQRGYSLNQKVKIKNLIAFHSEADVPTAWGEPEDFLMNSFEISHESGDYPSDNDFGSPSQIIIARSEFHDNDTVIAPPTSLSTPISEWTFQEPVDSIVVRRSKRPRSPYQDFKKTLEHAIYAMDANDNYTNDQVEKLYPTTRSDNIFYTLDLMIPSRNAFNPDRPFKIFMLFGWINQNSITDLMPKNPHGMECPSHTMMSLIFHIGKTMFGASVTLPTPLCDVNEQSTTPFMMYNPYSEPIFHGEKSTYVSNFTEVSDYISEVITWDSNSVLHNASKAFLVYVLLYDFMSFASSRLRRIMNNNESSNLSFIKERDARAQLSAELFTADNHNSISERLYGAFSAIIHAIQPSLVTSVTDDQPSVLMSDLELEVTKYENQSTPTRQFLSPRAQPSVTPNRRLRRILHSVSSPHTADMLVLISHGINNITTNTGSKIYDTGATKSGTGDMTQLRNLSSVSNISVHGPFGKSFQPKVKGNLSDMDLECLYIPGMKSTLISVSEACQQGLTFIFDKTGCHGYKTSSISSDLENIKMSGFEVARGLVKDGLYCSVPVPAQILTLTPTSPTTPAKIEDLLYADARPGSKFEHVHDTLGHPGTAGMQWHRKNTPGADFTDEDANMPRQLCTGCVLGGMRQGSTDHRRVHRPRPSLPGQQFAVDAFSCTTTSRNGHNYCDLFTDLCSGVRYPVFTKTRTAAELCEKTSILFDLHPDWSNSNQNRTITVCTDDASDPPDPRFIRVDAESNYKSTEFLHCTAKYNYKLERTPPRDKHANGIAERSVGLVTLKTNVAMLTPSPPVPPSFWDLAMDYACQTLSFCFNSRINTSPYYLLHKTPVPFQFLQPFWTPCYVHLGQKN